MKYLLSLLQEALKITVEKHKMGDLFIQLDREKVSTIKCVSVRKTVSIIKAVIAIYDRPVMVYEAMIIIFLKVIFFIYIFEFETNFLCDSSSSISAAHSK